MPFTPIATKNQVKKSQISSCNNIDRQAPYKINNVLSAEEELFEWSQCRILSIDD